MTTHGEPENPPEQRQPQPASTGRHAAPDDAGVHPLIDLTRDPTPGVPDHAAPDGADQ